MSDESVEEISQNDSKSVTLQCDGIKYKLIEVISKSEHSTIWLAIEDNTQEVVAKLEVKKDKQLGLLHREMEMIKTIQGGIGMPKVLQYGNVSKDDIIYRVMLMERYGPNLETLFNVCSRKFTMKTVLMLADQMLSRIEHVHSCHIAHRDIGPTEFVLGWGPECSKLFLIDYGLSKKFMCADNGGQLKHIPYAKTSQERGKLKFASLSTLKGYTASRRDDLESLGYVLMYLNLGELPWQHLRARSKEHKFERILEMKTRISTEELCKGFPEEFAIYLNYCKNLEFDEKPNYLFLHRLFRNLFEKLGYKRDYQFDWTFC